MKQVAQSIVQVIRENPTLIGFIVLASGVAFACAYALQVLQAVQGK